MSQALFQLTYSLCYTFSNDLSMFTEDPGAHSNDPDSFLKKKTWSLSETIVLLALFNTCGPSLNKIFRPFIFTDYFNEYYIQLHGGIASGQLKQAVGDKASLYGKLCGFIGGNCDQLLRLIANIKGKSYPLIDQFELDKRIVARDAIQYALKQNIPVPNVIQVALDVGGETSYSDKARKSAAESVIEMLKDARSIAGKSKYRVIRDFCENNIKPLGLRELEVDCRCFHTNIATRIKPEIESQALDSLSGKDLKNFMAGIDENIRDSIRDLFYELDDKFDNVKSRVFRGKYYDEYTSAKPSAKPCGLHLGK